MTDTLIRGGIVLTAEGPVAGDVLIQEGRVSRVGPELGVEHSDIIEAGGSWVGPGFVDLHAHLREPGQEHKEDIASGSGAAAAGGYTAVVAMPNTEPPIDSGHLARFVVERGREVGLVDVRPAGCISSGRSGTSLAHIDEMWEAGVRMFTDDGDTVADAGLLRRAMEYTAQLGGVICQHAVDPGLAAGGHVHEGSVSSRLGMQGVPALAEQVIVARDLALVRLTGARYHAQHLSTAGGVRLIAEAKEEGLPVTAEVTPHHLAYDHEAVRDTDPVFKMMPPLASADDRAALVAGLRDGVIDAVATDHAPHAAHEKDVPFEEAPFGVTGLEWAGSVVRTVTDFDAVRFFERMSVAPARIAGLDDHGNWLAPGVPANLVVFDPDGTFTAERTRSRSQNSPHLGRSWTGVVLHTIHVGATTWSETLSPETAA